MEKRLERKIKRFVYATLIGFLLLCSLLFRRFVEKKSSRNIQVSGDVEGGIDRGKTEEDGWLTCCFDRLQECTAGWASFGLEQGKSSIGKPGIFPGNYGFLRISPSG
jgi:hypothetical protein